MESILFNQLTETDYGQDNDELLLQQNGITKRVKSKNFFDGAIANAMHEKYTAGKLLVADEDGNIAESEKTEADLDKAGSAVTYVEQELTDEQKAQARDNIGLNDNNTFNGNKTFEGDVQIKGTLKSNSPMLRDVIQVKNIGNGYKVPVPVGHCVCVINAHSIYSEIALLINTDGTLGYMILAKKNTVGLTYTQTTDGYIINYGTGVGRVAYFDLFSI